MEQVSQPLWASLATIDRVCIETASVWSECARVIEHVSQPLWASLPRKWYQVWTNSAHLSRKWAQLWNLWLASQETRIATELRNAYKCRQKSKCSGSGFGSKSSNIPLEGSQKLKIATPPRARSEKKWFLPRMGMPFLMFCTPLEKYAWCVLRFRVIWPHPRWARWSRALKHARA